MIAIVGIGADGWPGLGEPARDALRAAPTVIGSERQLALLPTEVPGERRAWPSPIDPLVDALAAGRHDGAAVLASGDPMLHGIGSSLARRGVELAVHPRIDDLVQSRAVHDWDLRCDSVRRSASSARPRASRDMTVPMGTSTITPISL